MPTPSDCPGLVVPAAQAPLSPWSGAELARIALEAAEQAAVLVMRGFRSAPEVRLKGHDEPFTDYDLSSEALLRHVLAERTPGVPVVGEEGGGEGGAGLTWYCDPIDGTVNFMRGQPYFCVSVGVAQGSEPVAGAVVAPALGLRWHGSPVRRGGLGAFRNGEPCHASGTEALRAAVATTGLPLRRGQTDFSWRLLRELVASCREQRRCGSAAIELCLVAEGVYDLYLSGRLQPWDTCAGAAIALAAGAEWLPGLGPEAAIDLCAAPALVEPARALMARAAAGG